MTDAQSQWISLDSQTRLHVRRFRGGAKPALLFHGAVENGKIFYSDSGKGLAPYLARNGYDVYVLDLRGRGLSEPRIRPGDIYGQNESILQELPALMDLARSEHPGVPQTWIAHSWGGVLLLSVLARLEKYRPFVDKMVFFGTKRSVRSHHPERWFKIDLGWNLLCVWLARRYGYLPARRFGIGSDDETIRSHIESVAWVRPGPWVDPTDGFEYASAIQGVALPPLLSVVGGRDHALGNVRDVRDFLAEAGVRDPELLHLPAHDHINMLTDPRAPEGHFKEVLRWLGASPNP